jgi:hypothetical protein
MIEQGMLDRSLSLLLRNDLSLQAESCARRVVPFLAVLSV